MGAELHRLTFIVDLRKTPFLKCDGIKSNSDGKYLGCRAESSGESVRGGGGSVVGM